jgi:glycosyltransferase involved in cell wall biosynthesis
MRIALYQNLPSGGAKRALYEWLKRLGAHEIDVYTLSTADHNFCDLRPLVRDYRIYGFRPHKLFASPLGRFNQFQRWRDLGELTQLHKKLAGEINAGGYDVVFANPCLFTFVPILLQFVQTPSLYYLHEPFGRSFSHSIKRPYRTAEHGWRATLDQLDPLHALYHRRLCAARTQGLWSTTKLLANSRFTQEQMQRNYGLQTELCGLGVNSQLFYPMPEVVKEHSIISVGELTPRKGYDFLVQSVAQLPPHQRPVLKMVCNLQIQEERAYIEALAAAHGVQIQILSSLDTAQLRLEYNRARLCVYAAVQEPFGLVPLEAMACGLPVVAVAEGGVCESVVEGVTGHLVARNAAQFAQALSALLHDPERCRQYGQQARHYVCQAWNWAQSAAQLEQHLQQLVRIKSQPMVHDRMESTVMAGVQ